MNRETEAHRLYNLLKTTQVGSKRAGLSLDILVRNHIISSYATHQMLDQKKPNGERKKER